MNKVIFFIFILIFVLLLISEFLLTKINNKYDGEINIDGHGFKTDTLYNYQMVYLTNFLSSNECKYLVGEAQGGFNKSTTMGDPKATGG